MLIRAKQKVITWNETGAGTKYAPPPAPPIQNNDYDQPMPQPQPKDNAEDRRNTERQTKLSEMLIKDIQANDDLWLDYEIEDTQARLDVADMILETLAWEVVEIL